ncbi:hypothetical protein FisN_3Lh129 [Fistulifera solaris]|uniref:DUF1995 domain-containing protein n=1 Tax=Fistulifera solaris TaxID=1519565 RepID=A0A1Z5JIH0_FISSO|nr:hypothetical protein FisN_3Lh129 [Fistulifera solaris]|eukprot:GAX13561.1 hypothetical protein FisN_3Lh129 [Fistulifera solaris]
MRKAFLAAALLLRWSSAFYPCQIIYRDITSTIRLSSAASDEGTGDLEKENESSSRRSNSKKPSKRNRNVLSPVNNTDLKESTDSVNAEMLRRITQLEELVARQSVLIKKLEKECIDLTHAAESFAKVIELLREAGLQTATGNEIRLMGKNTSKEEAYEVVESSDVAEIFGSAPANVIEAADAAGASILAGLLGGKQRMLVDVRDADLANDINTLVQFLELAVLPVAAGLEGLKSKRNRLKLVFPTVGQLLHYRKTMALAAPEVVALSTLGLDPVEDRDNLIVIIAPSPDDIEGLEAMNNLLEGKNSPPIPKPVVVINHHMIPISGPAAKFEVAYHLRLLSVQYISGDVPKEFLPSLNSTASAQDNTSDDDLLEAAVKHALGRATHSGMTRAMVVRAYPRPWHVFVDTSPDTDADFEVAATFDIEPAMDEINKAIIECLEGSEQEDELVAKQMQEALEAGQLDRVNDMLARMGIDITDDDDDEDEDDEWKIFRTDSV